MTRLDGRTETMDAIPMEIAGCLEIRSRVFLDARGSFVKTFHEEHFKHMGVNTVWREHFWSSSARGVIRGLHFQIPPADHSKLVTCVAGVVWDVVVDLRRQSSTYGEHIARELSAAKGNSLYIPRGMAHGFLSLSEGSVMLYAVETGYDPICDKGIRWDTCGIQWPNAFPAIISQRDAAFPAFDTFESPF